MSHLDSDNFDDELGSQPPRRNDRNEEIERFKDILKKGGNGIRTIEALEEIVDFYFEQEKFDEALHFADQLIEFVPYSSDAWVRRGMILNNMYRYDEAIDCYERAVSLNPNECEIYINLGITFDNANRVDEALESFEKALSIEPGSDEALFNKAVTL